MKTYRLDSMPQTAISFDLETHMVQPGLNAPPMVLGSAAEVVDGQLKGVILDKEQARALFMAILDNPAAVLVVANGSFDALVTAVDFAKRGIDIMDKIFMMYDPEMSVVRGDCDGRVFEIQLAEPLDAIANGHKGKHRISGETIVNKQTGRPGRYSLDTVTYEVQGREDAKANDRFRLSYALFDDKPISDLPFEAWKYPIDDAVNTLGNALGQAGHMPSVRRHEWQGGACRYCRIALTHDAPQACIRLERHRNLQGLALQSYFAWAVHVGSAWGLHIPQDEVDKLEKRVDDAREAAAGPFKAAGFVRENGSVNESVLKRLTAIAYGARDLCPTCGGTCKVPSVKTEGRTKVNCKDCDGTGLRLPGECPRSDSGEISISRDSLSESGDELLMEYAEQPSKKIKTTYIPLLRRGRACNVCGKTGVKTKYKPAHEPWCTAQNGEAGYRPIPLIPSVDPLKETERASIEDGLHGIPRKGGVRECIVARPGYVFSSEDYTAGELVTLAWNCLRLVKYSKLADALNKKIDVHTALAGTFCGKSYEVMMAAKAAKEKWLDDLRQVGKKSNFGFGGGMAELEFILKPCRGDMDLFTPCPNGPSERKGVRGFNGVRPCILMDGEDFCGRPGDKVLMYNDKPTKSPVCIRCLRAGKKAREAWFTQWPEMRDYFKYIKKTIADAGPSGTPELVYLDGMVRGGVGFCDAANGHFQRTLAKAAKAAFCQVQRECLVRTRVRSSEMMTSRFANMESPLYGSRAILLFHDEIIAEHPESVASEGAMRVSEVMVESLRWQCPELHDAVAADPALMRQLLKGASARYARGGDKPADDGDRLIPWEPPS
jgi:DNA polymerase-1